MPVPRPSPARAIAAGVSVAAGVVVAVCALLAAFMVLLHLSDVDALARPARAGAVGGFGLFTLQAALAPNATVWTFAYVLGPGFSVGAGTTVSPTGVHLGDLPGLPMLGGASRRARAVAVLRALPDRPRRRSAGRHRGRAANGAHAPAAGGAAARRRHRRVRWRLITLVAATLSGWPRDPRAARHRWPVVLADRALRRTGSRGAGYRRGTVAQLVPRAGATAGGRRRHQGAPG